MSNAFRLGSFYFAYFAYVGAYVPYFSLYLSACGYDAGQIALVLAMPQLARVFAPAAWGWLADRSGADGRDVRRAIVALSCAVLACGYLAIGVTDEYRVVVITMAVMSALSAGALPIVESLALSALGAESGRYGPVRLWGSVSFIVAVLAVGAALDELPWPSLLWMIIGLLLGAFASALWLPAAAHVRQSAARVGLGRLLMRADVLGVLAASAGMAIAHGALYGFLSLHLEQIGYTKSVIGVMWTIGVIAEIGVFVWLPQIMRRIRLRTLLVASFVLAGVRFAMIAWLAQSWLALGVAQLLHGATFGVFHAASVAVVHRMFAGAAQATGQALYTSISYGIGGSLGMLLAGWTWQALGPSAAFATSAAFGFAGAVVIGRALRE